MLQTKCEVCKCAKESVSWQQLCQRSHWLQRQQLRHFSAGSSAAVASAGCTARHSSMWLASAVELSSFVAER